MGVAQTAGATILGLILFVQSGSALMCYECNSHNDSRCADALPPDTLKKECSERIEGPKYTMCRKIVQHIDFEVNGNPPDTRVIRGCGWVDNAYTGKCYSRSGFGGRQEVCSCLADLCNGVPRLTGAATLLTALLLAITRLLI